MNKTTHKIDISSIIIYLVIYSVAGFIIETIFGAITKGVIESRKSFIYGPFCAIYGVGAVTMILILKNQKSNLKIFAYGCIIGALVEYAMSYLFEMFFGVKWWDYSNYFLDINGRTCLFYAVSWGFLAIILIKIINPYVDKFINILREKNRSFKLVTIILIAIFSIDAIISATALKIFYYRMVSEHNLNIANKYEIQNKYAQIEKNDGFLNVINKYYNDEIMLKTYPNMMISEMNNDVYIENLVDEIEPYYYRLGEAF